MLKKDNWDKRNHMYFNLSRRIRIMLIAMHFFLATASTLLPVWAEEPLKMVQAIKLYEGVLKYPPPLWMKTKDKIGDYKISRSQEKNTFSFEMIPKSQDFESWTRIYGVYAWLLPDYDMKRFIEESLNMLALGCKKQSKSTLVVAEDGRVVMTYHCPALADEVVCNGMDAESGFLYMSQVNSTFVKVYQAWRYDSKQMGKEQSPMTRDVIVEAVENMKTIRFINAY